MLRSPDLGRLAMLAVGFRRLRNAKALRRAVGSIVRLVPCRYRTVPFSSSGREPWLTPVLTAKCFDTPLHQPLDPSCTAGVYVFAHLDDTI